VACAVRFLLDSSSVAVALDVMAVWVLPKGTVLVRADEVVALGAAY
jgi:hypothetical protein